MKTEEGREVAEEEKEEEEKIKRQQKAETVAGREDVAAWPWSRGAAAPRWRVGRSPHSSALFNGAAHEYCMTPAVGLRGRAEPG